MTHEQRRRLLQALKTELKFLEEGGYQRSSREDWRAQFIFEDSPTCMNYKVSAKHLAPCSNCALMPLVPSERQVAKWPCRHIPLNCAGETLDTLYPYGDVSEVEVTLRRWLHAQIHRIENERTEISETTYEEASNAPNAA